MMEDQVQIGWKVVLQSDASLNGQVSFTEIRVGVEIEQPPTRDRVNVEISGALLVQREVLEMNVRFNRRLLGSAAGSHREIGDAIHRNPAGLQPREAGEIAVTFSKIQTKLGVGPAKVGRVEVRTPSVRERGTGVEARRGVAVNERAIACGEMIAGVLDGGRECVPVNSSRGHAFGCRQDSVEVVDFEISADGKRGEFAAGIAGNARPAVDREGQIW